MELNVRHRPLPFCGSSSHEQKQATHLSQQPRSVNMDSSLELSQAPRRLKETIVRPPTIAPPVPLCEIHLRAPATSYNHNGRQTEI